MAQPIASVQAERVASRISYSRDLLRWWPGLRASRYYAPVRSALLLITGWRILLGVFGFAMNALASHCACSWNSALRVQDWPRNPLTLAVDAASRGDAQYYVDAAQHGYTFSTQHFSSMGFYPLYPILIRAASFLIGDAYVAALFVSTVALLVAVGLLAVWLADRAMATATQRVILVMFTFPFAFFYGALYTEPIYLALVLGAFLAAERKHWVPVSLCVALLTLTRPTGILVLLPLMAIMYRDGAHRRQHVLPIIAACVSLGGFLLYQYMRFGTPLAYVRAKAVPGWAVSPSRVLRDLLLQGQPGRSTLLLTLMLVIAVLFLASVSTVYRQFGAPYAVFVAVTVFGALSAGLPGMDRYVITAFPSFAAVASRLGTRGTMVLMTASSYILLFFLSSYVGGYGMA